MDKPRLKLPVTLEDWEEANCYFSQVLVTEVSPDSKNTVLAEGIYANKHGTRERSKRKKRQEKRAQALNRAKRCKNEARKQLRQARSSGSLSPEELMGLARKFFQLVRAHSRCKRAYDQAKGLRKAGQARHQCATITSGPSTLGRSPSPSQIGCHLPLPLRPSSTLGRSPWRRFQQWSENPRPDLLLAHLMVSPT